MYLNIGQSVLLPKRSVIGIFDLDNTTWSHRTREFLDRAERAGRVRAAGEDLPKSFVLWDGGVWLTQLNTAALRGRAEDQVF